MEWNGSAVRISVQSVVGWGAVRGAGRGGACIQLMLFA